MPWAVAGIASIAGWRRTGRRTVAPPASAGRRRRPPAGASARSPPSRIAALGLLVAVVSAFVPVFAVEVVLVAAGADAGLGPRGRHRAARCGPSAATVAAAAAGRRAAPAVGRVASSAISAPSSGPCPLASPDDRGLDALLRFATGPHDGGVLAYLLLVPAARRPAARAGLATGVGRPGGAADRGVLRHGLAGRPRLGTGGARARRRVAGAGGGRPGAGRRLRRHRRRHRRARHPVLVAPAARLPRRRGRRPRPAAGGRRRRRRLVGSRARRRGRRPGLPAHRPAAGRLPHPVGRRSRAPCRSPAGSWPTASPTPCRATARRTSATRGPATRPAPSGSWPTPWAWPPRGESTRLGRMLGPMSVRYIVVPQRAGPQASGAPAYPPPSALLNTLAGQLDLRQKDIDDAFVVYENEAWIPRAGHAARRRGRAPATRPASSRWCAPTSPGSTAVLPDGDGANRWTGDVGAGHRVPVGAGRRRLAAERRRHHGGPAPGLRLGQRLHRRPAGPATLAFDTPLTPAPAGRRPGAAVAGHRRSSPCGARPPPRPR